MQTYEDVLPTARRLSRGNWHNAEHIKDWNFFEDYLLGKLTFEQAEAIALAAENEQRECMAAGVLLSILR
jgi:hypothetical protein